MSDHSPSTLVSYDPLTDEPIWEGPVASASDIEDMASKAHAAQKGWAVCPLEDRIAIVQKYAEVVKANAEEFARLIARETGKPLWESRTEAGAVAAKVGISITAQAERAGIRETRKDAHVEALRHRPHGLLAVLGPYNFPAHLPNGHIVPALLAGNAVLFKPSEKTPATAARMVEFWNEAGLPEGVLQLVIGEAETGRALSASDAIDGLLFTGSSGTGQKLAEQFAATPWKILALEMGGNNPLVLWDIEDDDLDRTAALVAQSAFMTAGQRCTCARRLVVQDSLADRIQDRLTGLMDRLIVGAPFDEPAPFIGPVIDAQAADAMETGYRGLIDLGGTSVRALERIHDGKPLLRPGLVDMTDASEPADKELFGPLLQMYRVGTFDEAIDRANKTRFGLSASLVGGDEALFERFRLEVKAGILNRNRPTNGASSAAPFGGIGLSGNHRPSAYYAADYCAYPVAGVEGFAPEGALSVGVTDA